MIVPKVISHKNNKCSYELNDLNVVCTLMSYISYSVQLLFRVPIILYFFPKVDHNNMTMCKYQEKYY